MSLVIKASLTKHMIPSDQGEMAARACRRHAQWEDNQRLQRRVPMRNFDYGAEAELFPGQARASRQQLVRYRRFPRAADAICFAIEELPLESLAGAALEVGEERF